MFANKPRRTKTPAAKAAPLPADHPLAYLLNEGGTAGRVQSLPQPLTLEQADRLLLDYPAADVAAIFCEMANWAKLLTSSVSANLTARKWLDKRAKEATAPATAPRAANGAHVSQTALRQQALADADALRQVVPYASGFRSTLGMAPPKDPHQ